MRSVWKGLKHRFKYAGETWEATNITTKIIRLYMWERQKNLKRRVSSYFHKEVDRYKTKVLVSKIHDISYTVVNTEEDALLLENPDQKV